MEEIREMLKEAIRGLNDNKFKYPKMETQDVIDMLIRLDLRMEDQCNTPHVGNPKYIGYATYLNTRVSPVYDGDDIEGLLLMVEKSMNDIPKLGNCSFIIEPNLRLEGPDGFESYEEYVEHWEGY